jgi:hypothetical protein
MHKNFLQKINTHSLSQNKYFSNTLLQIFDFILRFCDRWRRGVYAINMNQVKEFEKEIHGYFQFISNILSFAINRIQLSHLQPLLNILLYSTK